MKSTRRSSLYYIYTTKNRKGKTIVNLHLDFEGQLIQGHVINFGLFEITDLELVSQSTPMIKSVSWLYNQR